MSSLTITFPDDWHCHLRDGLYLSRTVQDSAQRFKRVIVMPNLVPPITNTEQASQYRARILHQAQILQINDFHPLMTLYLTESTTPQIIHEAKQSGIIFAVKLYPAGATTHSDFGVRDLRKVYHTLEQMQRDDMPLLIHGEIPTADVDIFDREASFIEKQLVPLLHNFPNLRIVLEHISTQLAVEFVTAASQNLAATITPHHLLYNRNHLLSGGIRPHYYCLPILKTMHDQAALIKAATSGNKKFFLGTDSAPHTKAKKESCCGSAGIYSSHAAIEIYAQIFEQNQALDKLEGFASLYGPSFYKLPVNKNTLTLRKEAQPIPATLPFGEEELVPLLAGEELTWRLL